MSSGQTVGEVVDPQIIEASSFTVSAIHSDLLWIVNDSGNSATVYGVKKNGNVVMRIFLSGATNVDWEAIEQASCDGISDKSCLFIGDIGDNLRRRQNITIYRVVEPTEILENSIDQAWDKVTLMYPGQKAHDAESILIDRQRRLLLVITKSLTECLVFTASLDFEPFSVVSLQPTNLSLVSLFATDASSSQDEMDENSTSDVGSPKVNW